MHLPSDVEFIMHLLPHHMESSEEGYCLATLASVLADLCADHGSEEASSVRSQQLKQEGSIQGILSGEEEAHLQQPLEGMCDFDLSLRSIGYDSQMLGVTNDPASWNLDASSSK
mmetsp:Transcript_14345/g.22636  ORF Transcript_14345/g.22636 Transcript_14345/m.22636 type:complete len:114 (+) Transcript_14345:47-388(+)